MSARKNVWLSYGDLPVPRVQLSWVHDLLFQGFVLRREDEPGPGGRGRFRGTEAARTDQTFSFPTFRSEFSYFQHFEVCIKAILKAFFAPKAQKMLF